MNHFDKLDKILDDSLESSLDELASLVAIPSIAAQNQGLDECAQKVSEMLKQRGFECEIMVGGKAPIVVAERKGKSDKTIILYNHYDVQPPEPLELWESPPFEATRRGNKVFGRGISDDKGHFVSRLHAIDAILEADGELPCNVKFMLEGGEEIGSPDVPDFVKNNVDKLAADACIWEFGSVNHEEIPQQILGMRGICYVELQVETLSIDVHSGLGGSIFPNAAWRLIWALNTIKNEQEEILIEGHYDNVVAPTDRDRELVSALPYEGDDHRQRYGVKNFLRGVDGHPDLYIQEVFEPTATISGLTSGYQGQGTKTVQPAKASAKVDFRLVPNQTPEEILEKLRLHLDKHGFNDVRVEYLGGEAPGRTDPDDPFVETVVIASKDVYEKPQLIVPMLGGSGPNHAFLHYLDLPIATCGLGYPGSQVHAPNENIRVDLYLKASKHMARIFMDFAKS
jgi:acetylornithine deacetylase/succinyl-diaminopimelate desuccinylase-like protein